MELLVVDFGARDAANVGWHAQPPDNKSWLGCDDGRGKRLNYGARNKRIVVSMKEEEAREEEDALWWCCC